MTRATGDAMIRIEGVSKHFGDVRAVDQVSLDIGAGEFFALLGPSGCGKTTLLRMLAGFEHPTAGTVRIDGEDMRRVPANRRPVNMVFQSYAVFPHMTVLDNVAYGLVVTGTPKSEARRAAGEALEMVALGGYGPRKPEQLSGGQRQRVALARALVKRPKVLLLDEPLSALDAKLREQMRLELVNLQDQVGITFVFVTHDQDEALAMATRIAVMDQGTVRQAGPPAEIYEFPRNRFVADFIGSVNLFAGKVSSTDGGVVEIAAEGLDRPIRVAQDRAPTVGSEVWAAIRPEKLEMAKPDGAPMPAANGVDGVVEDLTYLGDLTIYHVRYRPGDGGIVKVTEPNFDRVTRRPFTWEDKVRLTWTEDCAVVVDS